MTALRTAGMVGLSILWGAALLLAWPLIRGSLDEARRNLERCHNSGQSRATWQEDSR